MKTHIRKELNGRHTKTSPSTTQRYGKRETTCIPTSVLDSEYSRSAPFIQLGGIRKLSTRKSGACIMRSKKRVWVRWGITWHVRLSLSPTSGYRVRERERGREREGAEVALQRVTRGSKLIGRNNSQRAYGTKFVRTEPQ